MTYLLISIAIGFFIGVIDIIPMIIQKLDKRAILSAFLQYFFVSIIILHCTLPGIPWWIQGSIISFALALPVLIIVSGKDRKAVPIIALMSVILGGLVSIAGYFIR